ncbi:MAG TPA: lycopene cyclase family protein [Chloroflexia bacterium]|nr:lycopene cyclase family protein [Chloroflexia bacterium]
MKRYDFIIVGGGLAGLSLACRLTHSPLRESSILVIDRSLHKHNDRTWAFWAKSHTPFDGIVDHSWHQLMVATNGATQIHRLSPYLYKVIRGRDFYRFAYETLSCSPHVEFMQGEVGRIEDGVEEARVYMEGPQGQREFDGRWVFDSRFSQADFHPDPRRYSYLNMHFRGWEIETSDSCAEASFDLQTPTFLDFRTPQTVMLAGGPKHNMMSFFYVLPYSRQRALVEYVACTVGANQVLPQSQECALQSYIRDILRIKDYTLVAQEWGINPMTDYRFPRRMGSHVMSIGVPGGMLKPTTGFAFTRIQRDSAAIVRSLLDFGQPFAVPSSAWGYRLYESLMLRTMARRGGQVGTLLATLFKLGSTPRILRFLDEQGMPI